MPELGSTSVDPIDDLSRDVFRSILDGMDAVSLGFAPADESVPWLSVPRIDVEIAFGLETGARTKLFFWKKRGGVEARRHLLRFALVASPDAPDARTLSAAIITRILEPPFLVSETERIAAIDQLKAALKALDPVKFKGEILKLEKDASRVICLRLEPSAPRALLIARVGEKGVEGDGLFVLTNGPVPAVEPYSWEGDDADDVALAPLNWLARTIRHWLLHPHSNEETRPDLPDVGGFGTLTHFVDFLRDGYDDASRELADAEIWAAGSEPHYYDLTEVEAELSYSVSGATDQKTVEFTTSEGRPYSLLESRVKVTIVRDGETRLRVDLLAPEFVLQGEKLRRFTRAAAKGIDDRSSTLLRELAAGDRAYAELYPVFLKDQAMACGAVCLLSYEGDTPTPNFLVVWPGPYGRDFIFVCRFDEDSDEISNVKVLLRLGDDIDERTALAKSTGAAPGVPTAVEEGALSGREYKAFHNFFHAVEIWRARTGRTS
jgi:hypothetical protein